MAVFKVTSDWKIVINPDAAKLVPELRSLNQDELLFCILVADNVDGPFRKKPLEERISMARKRCPDVDPESAMMKNSLNGYKGLVFDERRQAVDVLKFRYKMINREIETNLDMTANKMAEKMKLQELLMKRIEAIQNEIDSDEMAYEIKGGKKLSYLEQWQLNMKKYQEYQDG